MLIFFELLAALALGFVLGRLWEIRQEMQRAPEFRNRMVVSKCHEWFATAFRIPGRYCAAVVRQMRTRWPISKAEID
jgi:hypothetical protein